MHYVVSTLAYVSKYFRKKALDFLLQVLHQKLSICRRLFNISIFGVVPTTGTLLGRKKHLIRISFGFKITFLTKTISCISSIKILIDSLSTVSYPIIMQPISVFVVFSINHFHSTFDEKYRTAPAASVHIIFKEKVALKTTRKWRSIFQKGRLWPFTLHNWTFWWHQRKCKFWTGLKK